jgi:predicted RNA-binding protein YlxR (DUF448 family)
MPVRTCAGCRGTDDKSRLCRFVREADGQLVADPRGKRHGRGAHLHRNRRCLERALEGGFERAFKARVDGKVEDLWSALAGNHKDEEKESRT